MRFWYHMETDFNSLVNVFVTKVLDIYISDVKKYQCIHIHCGFNSSESDIFSSIQVH